MELEAMKYELTVLNLFLPNQNNKLQYINITHKISNFSSNRFF